MRYLHSRHRLFSQQCKSARQKSSRRGGIAVQSAIVGAMVLGMTALAVDVGYVAMTRTQLQAATDSSTLAGGIDLFAGLGASAIPASDVETNAKASADTYARANSNGDVDSTYIAPDRDVTFGWTVWDPTLNGGAGAWDHHWNAELPDVGGYNMIRVRALRDQTTSTNGDRPLSLAFARVMGRTKAELKADATAIILPANGITITPGSDETADAMPFAYGRRLWEKYLTAQEWYETNGMPGTGTNPPLTDVLYYDSETGLPYQQVHLDNDGNVVWTRDEPLFGHYYNQPPNTPVFQQDFYDRYSCGPCATNVGSAPITEAADGWLEFDAYPRDDFTSGNFGTIDIGSASNGTPEIIRQILYGVNATDMSYYTDNTLTVPFTTGGDTGLSAGIKSALDAVTGICKAIYLTDLVQNPGNTATFDIVGMAGVRVMNSELNGALELKELSLQYCEVQLDGAVGDQDEQIDEDDTVFTPLILIE